MTGTELKEILFKKRGEISDFARYCAVERQIISSRFTAEKVDIDILKKYAKWKGIDATELIMMATGPVPDKPHFSMVNETPGTYGNDKKNDTFSKIDGSVLSVLHGLIDNQHEQNAAMMKLANAAEINAITIAKMSGITSDDISHALNKKNGTAT